MVTMLAVVGPGEGVEERVLAAAYEVGRLVAARGAALVCGGLGGVMAAACRGAKERDGLTIGVLPGLDRADAGAHIDIALPTGLGQGRNLLIVRAADAVIAVGGSWGTLSEVALACRVGKPVVVLHSWRVADGDDVTVPGPVPAASPADAVTIALRNREGPARPPG